MTKAFKLLALSQLVANLADLSFRVLIIANIYLISDSLVSTSLVPILMGGASFATTFLVPLVSKYLPLNKIMFYTQAAKTFSLAFLTVSLYFWPRLPLLFIYLVVTLISLLDGFEQPITVTLMTHYETDLARGDSVLTVCSESVAVIGWGVGGALFDSLGIHGALLVTLCFFALATFLTSRLPRVVVIKDSSETTCQTLFKGGRLLYQRTVLKILLGSLLLEIFSDTLWVSSIILVFVTEILHETEEYWGYANMTYSLGIVIGGLVVFKFSKKINKHKVFSIVMSLILAIVMLFLILKVPHSAVFLLGSLLFGSVSQLKEIPEAVLIQESVTKDQLVDVDAVFEMISVISFSILLFIMSWITESFGIKMAFNLAMLSLLVEAGIVFKYREKLK